MSNTTYKWYVDEALLLIEWRPPSGSPILNRVVAGREPALRLAEDLIRRGATLDGAFRIRRLGPGGRCAGGVLHVDVAALRAGRDGNPTDPAATPWAAERSAAASRRRGRRSVRDALVEAWRDGVLEREQVADLLSTLDQALDGLGPASRRLPPRH